MSGFTDKGTFELTFTRASHWHRDQPCKCRSLADYGRVHLSPAGFEWHFGTGGNFVVVRGPGLADEDTAALYEAVSGKESWRPKDSWS